MAISHHLNSEDALPDSEWQSVESLCEEIIYLEETKAKLIGFLEGQMGCVAPNTAALVGHSICARLIAAAGGL